CARRREGYGFDSW
nr:immunoglobulin heavy chain junction region [Macaca mulatta]